MANIMAVGRTWSVLGIALAVLSSSACAETSPFPGIGEGDRAAPTVPAVPTSIAKDARPGRPPTGTVPATTTSTTTSTTTTSTTTTVPETTTSTTTTVPETTTSTTTTVPETTITTTTVPVAPVVLKDPLVGFLDRQGRIHAGWEDILRGLVVNVAWADLQPVAGGELVTPNAIDEAIDEVRAYNATHPDAPLGIRLRVDAGRRSPAWVREQAGWAHVVNPSGGEEGDVPFWWKPEVDVAYRELQARLAARYDLVPEIRDTQISRCSLIYPEPFLRLRADVSYDVFVANGLTKATDEQCHREQVEAHDVWVHTPSVIANNPYQDVTYTSGHEDPAYTLAMADHCRAVLGARCELSNHSLRATVQSSAYETMYEGMRDRGGRLTVQTAKWDRVGDLGATFDRAVGFAMVSIELPYGYKDMGPEAFAATYATTLAWMADQRVLLGVI